MLLIDDILLFPIKGVVWVFKEIHKAAEEDKGHQADAIRLQLSQLYMMLETGKITEAEFDAQEGGLLDELDELESKPEE